MAVAAPAASFLLRPLVVKKDSRAMLAVEGLVRKIVAADVDILAEMHFVCSSRRKRCGENDKGQRGRRKQPPSSNEVE